MRWIGLVGMVLLASACSTERQIINITGYNIPSPALQVTLPPALKEISGITQISGDTFACVQDEKGIVFLVDVTNGKIIDKLRFFSEGDYEGITKVENTLYVLRSDGVLYMLPDFLSPESGHITYQTNVPAKDNEGLCYDQANQRLLIGCKSNIGKGKELKDIRAIYAFDIETARLSDTPVLQIDVDELEKFARDNKIALPDYDPNQKKKEHGPEIKMRISCLAIHPVNKRMYILSAVDHLLIILNTDGSIHDLIPLDPVTFPQPEGITFTDTNEMVISNEQKEDGGTITVYSYAAKSRR